MNLAAAVNMLHHIDIETIRTDWWKRAHIIETEAPARLEGVPRNLCIEPAPLVSEATTALEGARYRHVHITTAGAPGRVEAEL